LIYTQSGTLYDKIPDAPRLEFSVLPPPKSNNDSHAGDGVIGTTDTKSTRATSRKARKISSQNEKEKLLSLEVNAVLTNKGKETMEVIDRNLDYNILLGRPWIYAMAVVVSTYFRKIAFPFQGEITIVDQQNFLPNGSQVTGSIPMIHGSPHSLQNIGVGLLKDPILMGTFSLPPPINLAEVASIGTCNMISAIQKISENDMNMDHTWVLPPSLIEIL